MGKVWGKTFFPMRNALELSYGDHHLNASPFFSRKYHVRLSPRYWPHTCDVTFLSSTAHADFDNARQMALMVFKVVLFRTVKVHLTPAE